MFRNNNHEYLPGPKTSGFTRITASDFRPFAEPRLARKRTYLVLKIVFSLMVFGGVILISPTVFAFFKSKVPQMVNTNPEPAVVSAEEASVISSVSTPNPSRLSIPSLGIEAPFEALGLNVNRTLQVPLNSKNVGWYVNGAKPGEAGASVIVGHLDSGKGSAIFGNLSKIEPGEEIVIYRADGSKVVYQVDWVSKFSQTSFPTQAVYGAVDFPAIRLITCSGVYNKKTGRYSENLIVFGSIK